ncbi:dephospho-CoA kinase [Oleiphilus sp. HI0130]|nr:dephospho-CoA kinase [Oleiphilus sp. HI0130]
MLIIGLTGGIGSGKSAASVHFEKLGIHVVDADLVAREVVEPGKPALATIAKQFGADILNEFGGLDRTKLRAIIFSDTNAKRWLEALLHPIIRSEIIRQISNAESPYAILVSPLLFETDQHKLCSRTLLIDAPKELQIERATKRDNVSIDSIEKIIAAQMPREAKQKHADDIILNDDNEAHLQHMVELKNRYYLELCQHPK